MTILCNLLQLYILVIFARIIISWFPLQPGTFAAQAASVLFQLTEPVLGPIRRVMPGVNFGGMGLDLSPIIVLFGIQLLLMPLLCT